MSTELKETLPYNKLKGLLVTKGIRQQDMAEMLDVGNGTFSLKINRKGGRDFTLNEGIKMAEILEVRVDDFF